MSQRDKLIVGVTLVLLPTRKEGSRITKTGDLLCQPKCAPNSTARCYVFFETTSERHVESEWQNAKVKTTKFIKRIVCNVPSKIHRVCYSLIFSILDVSFAGLWKKLYFPFPWRKIVKLRSQEENDVFNFWFVTFWKMFKKLLVL